METEKDTISKLRDLMTERKKIADSLARIDRLINAAVGLDDTRKRKPMLTPSEMRRACGV